MILKPKVLIYGINHQAEQLFRLLNQDKTAKVCGFVVDEGYKKFEYLHGLKVYEFSEMLKDFSPSKYQIVLSFGYKNMVKNRQEKYEKCKKYGYGIFTYVSKNAIVYSDEIGEGSIIYPYVYLAPFTRIGKGCFLENGASIAHHSCCDDFVFVAPNAVICGDTHIESNCFIGSNAVVTNSIVLKSRTMVAAGAKLSKSTDSGTVCFPAKVCVNRTEAPEKYI